MKTPAAMPRPLAQLSSGVLAGYSANGGDRWSVIIGPWLALISRTANYVNSQHFLRGTVNNL
jgi:hypothetical protein